MFRIVVVLNLGIRESGDVMHSPTRVRWLRTLRL